MKELNLSERKVLTLLEQNCRLSENQIAKKTRLSPEGVLKIINRLKELKIINKFNTKINYSIIDYKLYPVHLKLLRLNDEIINKIKNIIKNHKTCAWHTFCEGEYDLLLSFKIQTEKDKTNMSELLKEISDYTLEKEVSIVLYAFEISKSFIEEKNNRIFQTFNYNIESIDLTKEEKGIIELLKDNSRETILNMSKIIKINPRLISSKIKKLIKLNVISGFKTKINTASLNYQPCIALISLGNHKETEIKKFMTYCQYKEGIDYLVRQIGKYDIELTINAKNINDFYQIINDIRKQFRFVKKITTLILNDPV